MLLFCAILFKIEEAKSSSQMCAFLLPDVCQLSFQFQNILSLNWPLNAIEKMISQIRTKFGFFEKT